MRKLLLILIIALFVASCAADPSSGKNDIAYIPEIEDMPLPDGFHNNGDAVVYDTPEGRIVEVSANGTGEENKIIDFYKEALPQLGWKKKSSLSGDISEILFERDDELLRLILKPDEANLTITFSLSPLP